MNYTYRKDIGKIGEILAQQYLENCGYQLFEKNFSCRSGEIDIIAGKENILVFVEVKTRTTDLFGKPIESIGIYKINRIRKISDFYMSGSENFRNFDIRFDIISVFIKVEAIERLHKWVKALTMNIIDLTDYKDARKVEVEHIENAF